MPKIEFTEGRTVRRPDGSGTKYEAGKVYEMPAASADHFKSRGAAKAAPDKAKAVEAVEVDASGRAVEEAAAADDKTTREAKAGETQKLARRSAVRIPDDWRTLPDSQQATLANSLSDGLVHNKDEAVAAIEAEIKRRNA